MILLTLDTVAQTAVERVINSLPEGLLIAFGAYLLSRVRRPSSATRFVVWLIALVGVAGLPILAGFGAGLPAGIHSRSGVIVPSRWAFIFLAFWLPVTTAALTRIASGLLQLRRILRTCTEVDWARLDPALKQVLEQARIPARVLVSERVRVPAAFGFHRPAILLPAWALRELSPAQLRPVLIHELEHLRRGDGWTNLFQKLMRAVFFFHPAVWWIDARLSLEREIACDDAVVAATGDPHSYAGCLIGLLEKSSALRGWTMAQAVVARAREASRRIAHILHKRDISTARVRVPFIVAAAAFSLACAGVMLRSPRLLVFAPAVQASAFTAQQLPAAPEPALPGSRIVAAAFHPMPLAAHIGGKEKKRLAFSRRHELRLVAAPPARSTSPVVMSRFNVSSAATLQATEVLLVMETDLSAAGFDPSGNAPLDTENGLRSLVRLQAVQFLKEDSSGVQVHVIRIRITVPAPALSGSDSRTT